VSDVCCQVEIPASDRSLVQRSPTECVVSECDHESSIMSSPWPTRELLRHGKKNGEALGQELSFQMPFGLFYT
jgi:hypothetical protein